METYFAKFIVRCSEHLTIGKNRISFVNEIQDIPLTAASSKSNRITSIFTIYRLLHFVRNFT